MDENNTNVNPKEQQKEKNREEFKKAAKTAGEIGAQAVGVPAPLAKPVVDKIADNKIVNDRLNQISDILPKGVHKNLETANKLPIDQMASGGMGGGTSGANQTAGQANTPGSTGGATNLNSGQFSNQDVQSLQQPQSKGIDDEPSAPKESKKKGFFSSLLGGTKEEANQELQENVEYETFSEGSNLVFETLKKVPLPVWLGIIACFIIIFLIIIMLTGVMGIINNVGLFAKNGTDISGMDYKAQAEILQQQGFTFMTPEEQRARLEKELAFYERTDEVNDYFKNNYDVEIETYKTTSAMFNHIAWGNSIDYLGLEGQAKDTSNPLGGTYRYFYGKMTKLNPDTGVLEEYEPTEDITVTPKDYLQYTKQEQSPSNNSTLKRTYFTLSKMQYVMYLYHFEGCDGNPRMEYEQLSNREIAANDDLSKYAEYFKKGVSGSPDDEMNIQLVKVWEAVDEKGQCYMDERISYSANNGEGSVFYWNMIDEGFIENYYPDYISDTTDHDKKEKELEYVAAGILLQARDAMGYEDYSGPSSDGELVFGTGTAGPIPSDILNELSSPFAISPSSIEQTSCYGNYGVDNCAKHSGVDLKTGSLNTPVTSIADGKVIRITRNNKQCYPNFDNPPDEPLCPTTGCSGNIVTIEHNINGKTIISTYVHMRTIDSKIVVGYNIKKGEQLGIIGTSGCSTGVHLHFELLDGNNKLYNPEEVLQKIGVRVKSSCQIARNYCAK